MEKLLLIDGNSMLFRAYYATVYGQRMSTSEGIPTNAIYGFALMLQKAIKTIEPKYVMVAFDHGKDTYRHKEYEGYKGTRSATPEDLVTQFPIIREYLDAAHIVHYEKSGLEADDIIGSLAKQNNKKYDVNILSSDKDLLQLVDDDIKVWLMIKGISDIAEMDTNAVYERYTLKPLQIIDLKGVSGDPSDNIPGVSGVGDKTAIKLLNQYGSVENLYEHIDEIKGKLQEKLINDKENAFMSKRLATIIVDGEVDVDLEKCEYEAEGIDTYNFYTKYQMRSLASRVDVTSGIKEEVKEETKPFKSSLFHTVTTINSASLVDNTVLYYDKSNNTVGIVNDKTAVSMDFEVFCGNHDILQFMASDLTKTVYDLKSWYHLALNNGFSVKGKVNDLMIMAFLCDSKVKSVNDLLNKYNLPVTASTNQQMDLFGESVANYKLCEDIADRLKYLLEPVSTELADKNMNDLYWNIEFPLAKVLADMENVGICCDKNALDKIAVETKEKMSFYEERIYSLANKTFNINSPKQLAEVIYDDLALARSTKRSTDAKVLGKLADKHPIINEILQYRKYSKLYSTYAEGLKKFIGKDGKIHTIYNQCITETGRLSSSEPNLQNISVRNEETSLIRAAFTAEEGCLLVGADYSQVELRLLAAMANEESMIEAFRNGVDAHTKTAMDIFGVSKEEVTPLMRRQAKAINFGIDYGMSAFGLSESLQIPVAMASEFINSYFEKYKNIKKFMDDSIALCEKNGYVTTLLNRRREIPEIKNNNRNLKEFGKRAAMNAPVQGSAADLIKIAMINVYNRLENEGLKAKLILQIHDELILNTPIQEKDIVMKIVEEEMENAMKLSVPLVAEATCGTNWLEVK